MWLQTLVELLALEGSHCNRQDQDTYDARRSHQTFLTLMALNSEIPAAHGLWGALRGIVIRSDWAQVSDMIQVRIQRQDSADMHCFWPSACMRAVVISSGFNGRSMRAVRLSKLMHVFVAAMATYWLAVPACKIAGTVRLGPYVPVPRQAKPIWIQPPAQKQPAPLALG